MPKSAKPRKKYKPRGTLLDPMGYVLEGMTPIAKHGSYLLDLKIKNSMSMHALLHGTAKKRDMDALVAMSNIVEALTRLGFGAEYKDIAVEGRYAILSIIYRANTKRQFTPAGPEIKALQELMMLHDEQMGIITINDIEEAMRIAKKEIKARAAVFLPAVPEELAN